MGQMNLEDTDPFWWILGSRSEAISLQRVSVIDTVIGQQEGLLVCKKTRYVGFGDLTGVCTS